MFRTKKADAATASSRARPRSRSFSENTDYLGLDDDDSAARQYRPAQNASSGDSCSKRRAGSHSRGPKSTSGTTSSRRGRSLSRGRRSSNNGSNASNISKGGSFLETLRRRSRSRSRPRNASGGANNKEAGNGMDPNERWQSIVKTTGILSSQHSSKQHDEMNVRSENGFVGSRSGVDGRIVQGSRVPAAAPTALPASNDTRRSERQARSNIRQERQGRRPIPPQRTKRTAVPKIQTEHIRPASSSSTSAAAGRVSSRAPPQQPNPQPSPFCQTTISQHRQQPRRRHSFDGISDPRILDLDDELGGVEDCHEEDRDHHTVTTASVRTASSSQDRSRKSSLGQNSGKSTGTHSGRSRASVGRPRGVQRPSPPLRRDDQEVPDASRSAPSMLMSHRPMPSGAASVRSRDSRASSRRTAPVVSSSGRHAGGPVPTVDSIRLRASQQRKQQTSNRLKHSQQSMDDFRPPGLLEDNQPIPVQRQHVNYSAPTKAANGDEGHLEALKDHEGPSGGTVPRPITRAASRGRGRGRREYYQDNDDDDLMKRSHRSLGRSRSRSISRRARKEQRRAEREERAEKMMRRRASSMSRRHSSKDDVTDDSLSDDVEEEILRSSDRHQKEEAVVSSGSTLAASNYADDDLPRSTTKPWAEAYLNLHGINSSSDEREWQVDKVNQSSSAAPVDFSVDDMNRNEAVTDTEAGTDNMNDLQKRLMRLAAGRNRRAESKSKHAYTRHPQQETSKYHDTLQNSFASAVAIKDVDEDVFSSNHRHASSPKRFDQQGHQNAKSLHSSASTTEGALDGSLHFDGERIDYNGSEKYQSNHRCVLEDPFGLLDLDDNSSNSEQFKTADWWVKRNYEGGKAA